MSSAVNWLLDTNILSEAIRMIPSAGVRAQLNRYEGALAIPAPVWHELRYGWLRMAEGKKKDNIGQYLQTVVASLPMLPYDGSAARVHAQIRVSRERMGQVLPFVDGQIAAIAISHGLTLVTRNIKDFAELDGLRLANWFV